MALGSTWEFAEMKRVPLQPCSSDIMVRNTGIFIQTALKESTLSYNILFQLTMQRVGGICTITAPDTSQVRSRRMSHKTCNVNTVSMVGFAQHIWSSFARRWKRLWEFGGNLSQTPSTVRYPGYEWLLERPWSIYNGSADSQSHSSLLSWTHTTFLDLSWLWERRPHFFST